MSGAVAPLVDRGPSGLRFARPAAVSRDRRVSLPPGTRARLPAAQYRVRQGAAGAQERQRARGGRCRAGR
ncbi:TPA_asm: UL6 iORF RNA |nr:TPA_asm: UL6 iORF RNA \